MVISSHISAKIEDLFFKFCIDVSYGTAHYRDFIFVHGCIQAYVTRGRTLTSTFCVMRVTVCIQIVVCDHPVRRPHVSYRMQVASVSGTQVFMYHG